MILADSSACIEYFRATGSATHVGVRRLLGSDELATTGPVVLELTAGARTRADLERIRRMAAGCDLMAVQDPADYLLGATIYRACRAGGETIRSTIDCLIAAVAIRRGVELLHHDRDYDAIARHTRLRLA